MSEASGAVALEHKRPRLEPIDITEPPAKRVIGAVDRWCEGDGAETPPTRRSIDDDDALRSRRSHGDPDVEDDPAIGAVGPLWFDGDDEFGLRLQPTPALAPGGVHFDAAVATRTLFNRFGAPTLDEPFDDTMHADSRSPLSFEADDALADDESEAGDADVEDDDELSHAHQAARALEYSSDSDGARFSSDDDDDDDDERGARPHDWSDAEQESELGDSDAELESDELAESLGWR